jgi:hypothetical protein
MRRGGPSPTGSGHYEIRRADRDRSLRFVWHRPRPLSPQTLQRNFVIYPMWSDAATAGAKSGRFRRDRGPGIRRAVGHAAGEALTRFLFPALSVPVYGDLAENSKHPKDWSRNHRLNGRRICRRSFPPAGRLSTACRVRSSRGQVFTVAADAVCLLAPDPYRAARQRYPGDGHDPVS